MTSILQNHIANTICCVMSVVVLSGPAKGGDFCANVTALIAQAEEGFVDGSGDGAPRAFPTATDCVLSDNLNGSRSFNCMWEYEYRQPEASKTFGEMVRLLKDCLGHNATTRRDQPVNHPDFYDQLSFQTGDIEIALSIKDKSALQKTFTFVRIQSGIPE